MSRSTVMIVVALSLFTNAGCLVFERETMVITSAPGGKEARVLLMYEGLHPSKAAGKELAEAKEQLSELAVNEQTFYLGDPMFRLELAGREGATEQVKQQTAKLRAAMKVSKGTFFIDRDGRLCCYQVVTVSNVPGLVETINEMTNDAFRSDGLQSPPGWHDKETTAKWKEAAEKCFTWFGWEPGRITYQMPATPEAATNLKRSILRPERVDQLRGIEFRLMALRGGFGPAQPREKQAQVEAEREQILRDLENDLNLALTNPLSIDQRHDRIVISLGLGNCEPIRLNMPPVREATRGLSLGDPGLIEHAKTLKVPFRQEVTMEGVIGDFVKGKLK
jgi:hypothetical protein